jgi:hypothetical protein
LNVEILECYGEHYGIRFESEKKKVFLGLKGGLGMNSKMGVKYCFE